MIRRVEVARGLSMGGAETLLYLRLRSEIEGGLLDPNEVLVINTAFQHAHFAELIGGLGVKVLGLDNQEVVRGGHELAKRVRTYCPKATLVVHSPGPSLALKAARGIGQLSNPLIEVVHSTRYRPSYTALGFLLNRFADECVAVSQEVATAPTSHGFLRKTVVHGGVDRARMRDWIVERGIDGARDLRVELGIPADARLVATVGSLLRLKGHSDLLRAFARVRAIISNAHLLIVGSGPEMTRLRALVECEGINECVHLPGRLPDAWKALALADVQCHPSIYEGLPVALMEGAALGVPAVVTDIPGTRDFAKRTPGTTLVPVADADAIARALISVLEGLPSWEDCLSARGSAHTHWDISRYGREMNALIKAVGRT